MRPTGQRVGPLTPFRALDLTSDIGFLCGRILAELGCEVIKVEPPGNSIRASSSPRSRHSARLGPTATSTARTSSASP
ncbi:MAG: CoA transferase [Chloroflexi bacterium]|nr:CoA transferase [Chloroflexota bacterium]